MSTNCNTLYIDGELRLSVQKFEEFKNLERLPDGCFLNCPENCCHREGDEMVITDPWWYGEGSGWSFDTLKETILPATTGKADLLFVWEGAEFSGLRVENGVVTEHDVELSLGAPCSSPQR